MNSSFAIKRLREILRRQHKALSTEECYVFWLRRYLAALHSSLVSFSISVSVPCLHPCYP